MPSGVAYWVVRASAFFAPIVFFSCLFLFTPGVAFGASLSLAPEAGKHPVGTVFSTAVNVLSDGTPLNAMSGVVTFPVDKLEVVSLSKGGSIISLWVQEPNFSNTDGTVQFEGVVPSPGYSGTAGKVLTILFRVKAEGEPTLAFASGSVLANDGEGTEVLLVKQPSKVVLAPARPGNSDNTEREDSDVTAASDRGGEEPIVTSNTHPRGQWVKEDVGNFSFAVPKEAVAIRFSKDSRSMAVPTSDEVPVVTAKEVRDIPEGVSYLHVQYKTADGWSAVAHYEVKVDTAPPLPFSIVEVTPGTFLFTTSDALSGVARYEVAVDGGEPVIFSGVGNHRFSAPPVTEGAHTLIVKAYDEAGNVTESITTFTSGGAVSSIQSGVEDFVVWSGASAAMVILVLLAVLVVVLAALLYVAWRSSRASKLHIEKEVREARLVVHRAFAILRSDIEEDIEMLEQVKTERPLTKEELKLLQRLQKNLSEAENVINKEIEDIQTNVT